MRGKGTWFIVLFLTVALLKAPSAEASVIFNEIFADPPSGLTGDANNDGTRSATQDEFLELLNIGLNDVDVSGWSISDSMSIRHVFPSDTIISPSTFLVVFGGGNPVLPEINWQVASKGSLGLNNGGDSVTLLNADSQLIDQVIYDGIGNKDQSITLFPDGEGSEFFLHSTLEEAQGALFSPGTSVDFRLSLAVVEEEEIPNNPAVPELPTLIYFMSGWIPYLLRGKWAC